MQRIRKAQSSLQGGFGRELFLGRQPALPEGPRVFAGAVEAAMPCLRKAVAASAAPMGIGGFAAGTPAPA